MTTPQTNIVAPEAVPNSEPILNEYACQILQAACIEGVIKTEDLPEGFINVTKDAAIKSKTVQSAVFLEEVVKVSFSNGIEKYVSYEDFSKSLRETIDSAQSVAEGAAFNLPSNTFFFSHSSSEVNLNMYYAARTNKLKFINPDTGRTKEMDIVMPNLILAIQLKAAPAKGSWKIHGSRYFCTDLPVSKLPKTFINSVRHADRVYLMPMSNTYGEGNMCFGGNSMPVNMAENNLRTLDWYYQYLWESPFNSDLGIRAVSSGLSVKAWYESLAAASAEGKPFPYDKLSGWSKL